MFYLSIPRAIRRIGKHTTLINIADLKYQNDSTIILYYMQIAVDMKAHNIIIIHAYGHQTYVAFCAEFW